MSERTVKRFWKQVAVVAQPGGFAVQLDGRPVKTPAKAPLVMPSQALADAVAAEWDTPDEAISPAAMPFTRAVNAAIDKVRHQHGEVADMIAAYGDADLLCYRADSPDTLQQRQAAAWDPLLDWMRQDQAIDLKPVFGVMHRPQSADALARISQLTHAFDPFELTAFHDLVGLTGSFVLGLATARKARPPGEIWDLSRLDEQWQEEQWGVDDEAAELARTKRLAFLQAEKMFRMVS